MKRLLTGNEAVARGAYEAGISYAAAIQEHLVPRY